MLILEDLKIINDTIKDLADFVQTDENVRVIFKNILKLSET